MELIGAMKMLATLKRPCKIKLYSDSTYLINTMTGLNAEKTNGDLWERLRTVAAKHDVVEWIWLRREDQRLRRPHEIANLALDK